MGVVFWGDRRTKGQVLKNKIYVYMFLCQKEICHYVLMSETKNANSTNGHTLQPIHAQ